VHQLALSAFVLATTLMINTWFHILWLVLLLGPLTGAAVVAFTVRPRRPRQHSTEDTRRARVAARWAAEGTKSALRGALTGMDRAGLPHRGKA